MAGWFFRASDTPDAASTQTESLPPATPEPATEMSDKDATSPSLDPPGEESSALTLHNTIRSSREFLSRAVTAARLHSPLNEEKLASADAKVEAAIHGMCMRRCRRGARIDTRY